MCSELLSNDYDLPPFLVAQWSVVRVEGRDVSRQGNVVRSNQSGVPSPSSPLDCSIGRMFPVSPTSHFSLIDIYYKLHNLVDFIFKIVCFISVSR